MKDWQLATEAEIEMRRKEVAAAAKLISTSSLLLLEDAEQYAAGEYGVSWGFVSELVACFMCRLAEPSETET